MKINTETKTTMAETQITAIDREAVETMSNSALVLPVLLVEVVLVVVVALEVVLVAVLVALEVVLVEVALPQLMLMSIDTEVVEELVYS